MLNCPKLAKLQDCRDSVLNVVHPSSQPSIGSGFRYCRIVAAVALKKTRKIIKKRNTGSDRKPSFRNIWTQYDGQKTRPITLQVSTLLTNAFL